MCTGNYKSNEYTKYTFFSFVLYKLVLDLEIAKGEVTDEGLLPSFKRSLYKNSLGIISILELFNGDRPGKYLLLGAEIQLQRVVALLSV